MAAWLVLLGVAISAVAAEGDGERGERSTGSTVLADIAQELIARSGTSSQVLSLNLTNLVILMVLKGLLVAAAMWGAKGGPGDGAGGGWQRGRSDESPLPLLALPSATFLSEPELALLVSYLMGESSGSTGSGSSSDACLLRVACEEPKKAREYIAAGRMAIKAAKILDKVVPVNPKYARLLDEMAAAAQQGAADDGGPATCRRIYQCGQGLHDHNGV